MKSIVGMSDVGFGNALMLAKNHEVSVVDIDTETYAAMLEALAQVENDENNKPWWSSILNTTHQSQRLGLMK